MSDMQANIGNESVKGPDIVVDVKLSPESLDRAAQQIEALQQDSGDEAGITIEEFGGGQRRSSPTPGESEIKLEGLDEVNANLSLIRDSLDRLIDIQSELLGVMQRVEEALNG